MLHLKLVGSNAAALCAPADCRVQGVKVLPAAGCTEQNAITSRVLAVNENIIKRSVKT